MLEARGLVKKYPGVTALAGVDFSVHSGEVVALIGENGAGKSTLIKIVGGLVRPDQGDICIDSKPVRLHSPADATKLGIGIIHQELSNLDNLDIAANVFLGREPTKLGIVIDRDKMVKQTQEYLDLLGIKLSPRTSLAQLSIAQQQMVEIAKALSLEARFLIMDEPTSSLTAAETERLLKVVMELRSQGVGIVYVSHRLDEVKLISDRVVALRDGANAGGLAKDTIDTESMVRLMVGRDVEKAPARTIHNQEPALVVENLRTTRFPNQQVSLTVGKGEIVAIAGLVGSGRTEVVQTIFGVNNRMGGSVTLNGTSIPANSPKESIKAGLFLAPEDRRHEGLITSLSLRENVTLPAVSRYCRMTLIDSKQETKVAGEMKDKLRIRTPNVEAKVSGLSGGNQQKVVLGKWLCLEPQCLIFDEPTRGIDVGARAEIYSIMRELADQGVAILMVSSDMEEVLAVSDRIIVMHEGKISGEVSRDAASEEEVMRLAVGNV